MTAKQKMFIKYLLAIKMVNHGDYEPAHWKRMQRHRYRARVALKARVALNEDLHWDCDLAERIDWETGSYTPGQSGLEEITNLMRQLVYKDAKWQS